MVLDDPFAIVTCPAVPSGTVTRLEMAMPAANVWFALAGSAAPAGYTVNAPDALEAVAVTLRTTDAAPLAGTPPCPATVNDTAPLAASGASGAPSPVVVSRMRADGTVVNVPGALGVPETK